MKILQLISSRGRYGAENMLVSLAENLADWGVSVTLAAFSDAREPHTEMLEFAARRRLQTVEISCAGRFDWHAVRQIRSLILEQGINVVHSHGYKADIYSYFACRHLPAIRIATCHNWPSGARILELYAAADRRCLREFDRVSTPSRLVAELLTRAGVAASKICCIANGVNVQQFSNADATLAHEIDGFPLIGLVGRLTPQKGGFVLLVAAKTILARFPRAKFIFVGDGPARADLMSFAKSLEVDQSMVFAGARNDMPGVYASLDVVALPSLEEAMPMCLLEAMAARRPVVATKVGAVPEVVRDNVTGCLVEPIDANALADAVLLLLENPSAARRMADSGYEHVVEHYSNQVMTSRYLELYSCALRERFPSPVAQQAVV